MKRLVCLIALVFVVQSPCFASIVLDFGSVEGGTHGSVTGTAGSMVIDTGDLELVNVSGFSMLSGSTMVLVPFDIGLKETVFPASYSVAPQSPVSGFQLEIYNNIDGNGAPELILSGDVHIDTLLTMVSSGTLGPLEAVDVTNIALHNTGMMISEWGSVPTILAAFASFGVADMLINLSASGADLTQAIDLGNDVANISVTGSLSAVPEPSMMMLFAAGLFYCAQRIKRR